VIELESSSPEETERIAAALAVELAVGDVVTVAGELGSGKTTFVRGACRALGVEGPVTSPTYTIGHRYGGRVDVSHLDLYRYDKLTDGEWGDLERYFEDAVVFVEWPEAAAEFLPQPRAEVHLRHEGPRNRLVLLSSPQKSLEISILSSVRPRV
jgi:tRNA threonylcarbamoyladenosine biosynthesis protein TsaE